METEESKEREIVNEIAARYASLLGPKTLFGYFLDMYIGKRIRYDFSEPEKYIGSKRRCWICGAVDGARYPKFLLTLTASGRTEVCELYRGLCNRLPCKRNRRFSGEIPTIAYCHGKVSYPSGDAGEDVPVHWTLIDWATNPLPSDGHKLTNCWTHPPTGAPDERTTADFWQQVRDGMPEPVSTQLDFGDPPTGRRETYRLETYKTDSGEWKTRKVVDDVFEVKGNGTRKQPPFICDFTHEEFTGIGWSRREAIRLCDAYNSDPKTLVEHRELMQALTSKPILGVKRTGEWLWLVVGGLNPTLEEIMAKQWDEKNREKFDLPPAVLYGEAFGGTEKEAERTLNEFFGWWRAKLNPEGWTLEEMTSERRADVSNDPEFKRAYAQYLVEFHNVRVDELDLEKKTNTVAQWLGRERHDPYDSISEDDRLKAGGHYVAFITLNNRTSLKVLPPHDTPFDQVAAAFKKEWDKSKRVAIKNAKRDAKQEGLGKKAAKALVEEYVARVDQAYRDGGYIVRWVYPFVDFIDNDPNAHLFSAEFPPLNLFYRKELASRQDTDVTFSTITERQKDG